MIMTYVIDKKDCQLTKAALKFLGFVYWESTLRENLNGTQKQTEPVAIFSPPIKIEVYATYQSKHEEKTHYLKKFTLPNGKVFSEVVQSDIKWRKGPGPSVIYTALQDEDCNWIEKTKWQMVHGKGFYGSEMRDPLPEPTGKEGNDD